MLMEMISIYSSGGFDWYKIINDSCIPGRMRKVTGMTLIPVGNTIVRKT